jgi:hypothetical protein
MNIKQSLLLLLTLIMVFSCKQDEILDQDNGNEDLTTDISQYDNSNLGLYKGTFTTLDASERGIVEVKVLNNVPSKATVTLVSGATYALKSIPLSSGRSVTNLEFTTVAENAVNLSFNFSVNEDGSNPSITNVILGSRASDIQILKERSNGPVALITGTWTCNTNCLPNMVGTNQTFNMTGTGGTFTPQITLNAAVYTGSATQGTSTVQGDFETATITGSAQVPQGPGNPDRDINFTATHRWRTASPNCSTVTGTWNYESPTAPGLPASGPLISDVTGPNCPPVGDSPGSAIPFPIVSPGTCVGNDTFINLLNGGFTASGIASSCANLANKDIFYSWTATTDGITISGGTGANGTNPQVTVYDFTGGVIGAEIECTLGSNLGNVTASGWSVSDELLVRVSASRNIGVCFAEFTLPAISANDLCADAIALNCGDTVTGNTVNDNNEHNGPLFRDGGNDVYYTYTEGTGSQTITLSLCGSGFDTTLYVYSNGCALSNEVISGDDECGGQSEVTFTSISMTTYTIVVDGSSASGSGASGNFSLNLTCVPIAVLGCGDTIVDDGGIGGAYSDFQVVTYEISSGDPTLVPTLTFAVFDLDIDFGVPYDFMRFFDGPSSASPEILLSDNGVTAFADEGFYGTQLMGDAITATQQYLTVTFFSDCCSFDYFEGYEAVISCAVPFAGSGTGRQVQTIVNNSKSVAPTKAQIAERKIRMKELKLRGN